MGFRYERKTPDRDDAGTFESSRSVWQAGDVFIEHGNTRWRIVSVVPVPLAHGRVVAVSAWL